MSYICMLANRRGIAAAGDSRLTFSHLPLHLDRSQKAVSYTHLDSINKFLGGLPRRYEAAEGPCKMESVLFSIDTETKRCVKVQRLDIM